MKAGGGGGALRNVLRLREPQTNSAADNMMVSLVMGAINIHYGAGDVGF